MAWPLYIILSVGAILLVVLAQRGYSWSVLITKNIFCNNSGQQKKGGSGGGVGEMLGDVLGG